MCDLYRKIGISVAEQLNFEYPYEDDKRVTEYLKGLKAMKIIVNLNYSQFWPQPTQNAVITSDLEKNDFHSKGEIL